MGNNMQNSVVASIVGNDVVVTLDGKPFEKIVYDKGAGLVRFTGRDDVLVNFRFWVRNLADRIVSEFSPPEGMEEKKTRHYRKWKTHTICKLLSKLIKPAYDSWVAQTDPTLMKLQRRLYSLSQKNGVDKFAIKFILQRPNFLKDCLRYDAACFYAKDNYYSYQLDRDFDWRKEYNPSGLKWANKFLDELPGGISSFGDRISHIINECKHNNQTIQGKVGRIGFLGATKVIDYGYSRCHIFLHTPLAEYHKAAQLVFEHQKDIFDKRDRRRTKYYKNLLRKTTHVFNLVRFILDCPEARRQNTLNQMVRASIRWHRQGNFASATGLADSTPVATMEEMPDMEGVTFLGTVGAIRQEGKRMGHCVASYADKAVRGESFLFHIKHGKEQATLELSPVENTFNGTYIGKFLTVSQVSGPKNSQNGACKYGERVFREWLTKTRNSRAVCSTLDCGTLVLDGDDAREERCEELCPF
jgi:hypothetical protein